MKLGSLKQHWLCAALLVLLLAACAQQTVREARPARDTIRSYTLDGRVSVKRGNESRQAGIDWQHERDRDEIELSGPLGQRAARLTRDADGATLLTSSRETVKAQDWGTLAERVLGVALPLDGMSRWVMADIPDAVAQRDAIGRPRKAIIDGWQIDYVAYESEAADALPTLIDMHRDDIDVRLKIDIWEIVQNKPR